MRPQLFAVKSSAHPGSVDYFVYRMYPNREMLVRSGEQDFVASWGAGSQFPIAIEFPSSAVLRAPGEPEDSRRELFDTIVRTQFAIARPPKGIAMPFLCGSGMKRLSVRVGIVKLEYREFRFDPGYQAAIDEAAIAVLLASGPNDEFKLRVGTLGFQQDDWIPVFFDASNEEAFAVLKLGIQGDNLTYAATLVASELSLDQCGPVSLHRKIEIGCVSVSTGELETRSYATTFGVFQA